MIDQSFKKGDKIVRFGRVFEIFKIQAEKNSETGESERLMYFVQCTKHWQIRL